MLPRTSTALLDGLKDFTDSSAWREFDIRYRPLLMAVGARLGLSIPDAEDCAQETLAAFIGDYAAGSYQRDKGRLRDWLAGIMAHKVQDIGRQRRRQQEVSDAAVNEIAGGGGVIAQAIEQEWAAAVLRDCLERVRQEVTPQTFESFELFALQDNPAEVVARQLGISTDVVYQNKRRVLQRIRQFTSEIEKTW